MYTVEMRSAALVVVEHIYALAFRLGLLSVDSDNPLKRLAALLLPIPTPPKLKWQSC